MPTDEPLPSALVLDTHVWVWMVAGHRRALRLADFEGRMTLSAISLWAVAMLAAKGRLELDPSPEQWIEENLAPPVFLQPLTPAIASRSATLEEFYGDPTDRIILATAWVLGQSLVTADGQIRDWVEGHPECGIRLVLL